MTAHELARALLDAPDLPVVINGWGSSEGFSFETTGFTKREMSFEGARDGPDTPKDEMDYELPRSCILLWDDEAIEEEGGWK